MQSSENEDKNQWNCDSERTLRRFGNAECIDDADWLLRCMELWSEL